MATGRSGTRAHARLAATAAALVACSCDASSVRELLLSVKPSARSSEAAEPPQPAPAPALASSLVGPSITIVPPAPRDPAAPLTLELTGERRFAGGRPVRWWADRLVRLRKEGRPELYELTLARARLCGLTVEERAGGEVAVTVPPAPTAAAAAPRPETRP
jgi:hypothetical protein